MKCHQAQCKGVDHKGLCWLCPHSISVEKGAYKGMKWEDTPCSRCFNSDPERDCDSREQGHGRVISYEEAPPFLVSTFGQGRDEEETEHELAAATDVLRRILRLEPKEYVTLIESVRFCTKDERGVTRTLNQVKAVTNELFKEDISFQMVAMRLAAATRKVR